MSKTELDYCNRVLHQVCINQGLNPIDFTIVHEDGWLVLRCLDPQNYPAELIDRLRRAIMGWNGDFTG